MINGVFELIAGIVFYICPDQLGFTIKPLDNNSFFLFKAWAMSIIGFAFMTLAAASDAKLRSERTKSITIGAIFYHLFIALTYM